MKPIVPPVFPWKDHTKYTYPLGLDIEGICFLSGNSASEYDAQAGKIVIKGDLLAQIETALAKIRAVLEAAGLSFNDVVSVVQYVAPQAFASIGDLNRSLGSYGLSHAASHVVPVNRLMRREALIELEVVAAPRNRRKVIGETPRAVGVFSEPNDFVLIAGHSTEGEQEPSGDSLEDEVMRMERLLDSLGMNWENVARSRLILASANSAELDEAVRMLTERIPALPTMPALGVARLPSGRAQISIEACVTRKDAEVARITDGALVRRVGAFLMATGLQARDVELDMVEQVEQIYGSVVPELLTDAGMGVHNIVQTVEWVTEDALPDYRQTGATRRKLLREPFPVASGLVCSALPRGRKVSVDILVFSE
ncbi:MAG: hypothetical protein IT427_14730 [Pirellulales bacterium]|nr:hypothetical protein [Pirellulales bacterium]